MPARDTLGVELYPQGIVPDPTYTRGRVAAIISDVKAVYNDDGTPKQAAADGKDSVIRVSTANSYDKYGRVIASYAYDPTLPDSLKQLWTTTEYDVGGKVLSTTKYPYGSTFGSAIFRAVTERYTYDRLGRVSYIDSKNGTAPLVELAHYEYYPTGSVRTVTLGNSLTLSYTYHISGAVKTAMVMSADNRELYADTLYYEDCGNNACTQQYNGNISRMAHHLAHGNSNYGEFRDVRYTYDELNRLINVNDSKQDVFDEIFAYDAQGRIVAQRRDTSIAKNIGGEYAYYANTNRLKSVADGMGGSADERNMSDTANFVYDSEGNLVEDRSKGLKISYDWRGMPVEFRLEPTGSSSDTARLSMMYDGSGRRISKTFLTKSATAASWDTVKVTHYTGIGTEVREEFHNGTREKVNVVVNMPQGLGRYKVADASQPADDNASRTFEWYLKNHLGSTMLVYGTVASTDPNTADIGETKAAYDYRAFGEQVELMPHDLAKVTENFTGKERDDETKLNYFGARYLDPMLGMWISVDPKRQFASPYLYAGNGYNPVNVIDEDGNFIINVGGGLLSVAGGVGLAVAQSVFFGKEFDYTPMDAVIDFAFGCVGAGLVKKLGAAKDLINKAQVTRIEKHVTFKKSGTVATKHKWANRADAMEEQGKKAAAGALVGQGLKMGAKQLVKYAEDAVVPDPDPALVIKTGSENGSISPSDNTSTQLEIDK
ncbi:MAG: RHS repeat-associated core domain-containing protein [Fibrobacter sp.]|nr:RHS repeat-associated core domain-containing protein [Fibrobacter sp.]